MLKNKHQWKFSLIDIHAIFRTVLQGRGVLNWLIIARIDLFEIDKKEYKKIIKHYRPWIPRLGLGLGLGLGTS